MERTGPACSYSPAPYQSAYLIRFANGIVVNTQTEPPVAAGAVLNSGTYWLANLTGPVGQEWLGKLNRLGAEPVCYLAFQTIVCRVKQNLRAQDITRLWFIHWLGPFLPEYKLAPELDSASGTIELILALWPEEPAQPVADAILAACGSLLRAGPRTIRFTIPADRIREIACLEPVAWIQMPDPVKPFNSEAQWVTQIGWQPHTPDPLTSRRIWAKGIRGQGMIVGLFDSGINTDHDQFCDPEFPLSQPGIFPEHRKIAGYKLYRNAAFGDCPSHHGSGVAATLAGDDSVCGNYSKADGMAPDARVFFVDVATALGTYVFDDDLTDLLDSVRLGPGLGEPVRQVSGSFGSSARLGYYRLMEATLDAVTWQDKNFLVVWAAGNMGGARFKIGHPACAKNGLTVGATGNGTQSNQMADFSSRGPTRDNRIKPNIVAPGQGITTVDGPGNSCYSLRNGTSLSAPGASGALVLLRQYFRDGWFPFGTPDTTRRIPLLSAALVRALAIAGADSGVSTGQIPDNGMGWGRLNLSSTLHFEDDSVRFTFSDETLGLATGQYHEYYFEVEERKPLRVVLAWTDTAAAPETEIALVNDLNLELISPDQNGYRGNQFLNGQSRCNPPDWDERNVEEVCQLNMPLTGTWTVRVRGRNVYTRLQPYALVVKGSIAGVPGIAAPSAPSLLPPLRQTVFVSPSHPLRLRLPAGSHLTIFTSDGRRATSVRSSRENIIAWHGTDTQNRPLPFGIYFYKLNSPESERSEDCHLMAEQEPILGKVILIR